MSDKCCKNSKCKGLCTSSLVNRKPQGSLPDNDRQKPTYMKTVLTICGQPISYFDDCGERVMIQVRTPIRKIY